MVKKKTSPETSLLVTGKCKVTKSAKVGLPKPSPLGKEERGPGPPRRRAKEGKGHCLLMMRMIVQMSLLKERKMRRLKLSTCRHCIGRWHLLNKHSWKDPNLMWSLIAAITNDATIKQGLFPIPGANVSTSKGPKTELNY